MHPAGAAPAPTGHQGAQPLPVLLFQQLVDCGGSEGWGEGWVVGQGSRGSGATAAPADRPLAALRRRPGRCGGCSRTRGGRRRAPPLLGPPARPRGVPHALPRPQRPASHRAPCAPAQTASWAPSRNSSGSKSFSTRVCTKLTIQPCAGEGARDGQGRGQGSSCSQATSQGSGQGCGCRRQAEGAAPAPWPLPAVRRTCTIGPSQPDSRACHQACSPPTVWRCTVVEPAVAVSGRRTGGRGTACRRLAGPSRTPPRLPAAVRLRAQHTRLKK